MRQPEMRLEPQRLVFLDETGTTTKMTRLCGRCPKGQRLLSKAPFGHWKTQTFIAGLRCGALTAPFVIDAPMDRRIFETYIETQLGPTLRPGDVVILDNLPAHKSAAAETAIRARGAWILFLPPYSPDLNPIEMAFAKLKALLRAKAVRTIDRPLARHWRNLRLVLRRRMSKLLRRSRLRIQMKIRRSSARLRDRRHDTGQRGAVSPARQRQQRDGARRAVARPSYWRCNVHPHRHDRSAKQPRRGRCARHNRCAPGRDGRPRHLHLQWRHAEARHGAQ